MLPAISASTSGLREMLQGMTWASPPALRMPSAAASQASALRLEITTLAPSLASSSAEERPMPRLEPVTTATLPVRSNGVFFTGVSLIFSSCDYHGSSCAGKSAKRVFALDDPRIHLLKSDGLPGQARQ